MCSTRSERNNKKGMTNFAPQKQPNILAIEQIRLKEYDEYDMQREINLSTT